MTDRLFARLTAALWTAADMGRELVVAVCAVAVVAGLVEAMCGVGVQ
jgi:hypothetical protein